jgi:polyisoprenoid-binding protein YceI
MNMNTQSLNQSPEQSQVQENSLTSWEIDPAHSSANFSIRHMMIAKVNGGFTRISGKLRLNPKDLSKSSIEALIDSASIDTREQKRDEHLRSADFFDVQKYPTITFNSKRVEKSSGEIRVTGDLTLHGVTKEIVLTVEGMDSEMKDPWGNVKIGASATTRIKRKDFGLSWNAALEAGGMLVGDDVTITLDIQFVKKA